MNIVDATHRYERWMGKQTAVVKADLQSKHELMRKSPFTFLRATFYRWIELCPELCSETTRAPVVISVGDLHVENFGTWRDAEGRLIWGVNDFDEAHPLAYTNDLVRLAVSAHLAAELGHLPLKHNDLCNTILNGYEEGIREGGRPFVLSEHHTWLRGIAESELRDPVRFWTKMDSLPPIKGAVPVSAIDAIEHLMPVHDLPYQLVYRVAGLGSLGHARFVAIADWKGGKIAREAKALVSSACCWAHEHDDGPPEILYQTVVSRAVRCLDPFVQVRGRWIVRRLSPHCSRIELATLKAQGEEL